MHANKPSDRTNPAIPEVLRSNFMPAQISKRRELSFDSRGINGPDEFRSRVATFTSAENAEKYGRLFEGAPELLAALRDVCEQYDTLLALHPQPPFGWGKITTQPAKELIARIEGKPTEKDGAK